MIKRLVIAAVLMLLSFFVSLLSLNFVVDSVESTVSIIEGSNDDRLCAEQILALWEKDRRMLALLLKHADTDRIESLYIELEGALQREDADGLSEILCSLKAFLSVTAEGEKIKTENIF